MNTQKIYTSRILPVVVVAAALLFTTAIAEAKIVVEGEREFRDEVNDCFATYGAVPGRVGEVIKELQDSEHEHKIVNSENWTNTPNDVDEATGGKGSGTVTRVDSKKLEEYVKKIESLKNKDFCTALLHEMWHAYDADQGTRTPHSDKIDGAKRNEVEATLFQNLIHAIRGVDPRTTYGGIDISKHVVIGFDDKVLEEEPTDEPDEAAEGPQSEEVSVGTEMTYAHVKPGEYSEVYLTVRTMPGSSVDVTLKGPGVDSAADMSQTTNPDGTTTFTYRIVSYGSYTAEGMVNGKAFTDSVNVQ